MFSGKADATFATAQVKRQPNAMELNTWVHAEVLQGVYAIRK